MSAQPTPAVGLAVMAPSHVSWCVIGGGMVHVSAAAVAAHWPLLPPAPTARPTMDPQAFDRVMIGGGMVPSFGITSEPVYSGGQMIGKTRGRIAVTGRGDEIRKAAEWVAKNCPDVKLSPPARLDPREQGPGIARLPQPKPTTAPDVVYTWEAWALP